MMKVAFRMMKFVFTIMKFVFNMMMFVFNMMNFAFKMMNFAVPLPLSHAAPADWAVSAAQWHRDEANSRGVPQSRRDPFKEQDGMLP